MIDMTLEDLTADLTCCGVTENDAKVYLHLYRHGSLNPSQIAKGTGIQRPRVYDSIKRLMEKEYVIQNLDEKRAQYLVTDPHLILEDIQAQINTLMSAGQELRKFLKTTSPQSHLLKGNFQYNSDRPLRVALLELMNVAQKRMIVMFGGSMDFTDETLIPTQLLRRKATEGVDVTLILFVDQKNWKACADLQRHKVKVYHFPEINTETMIHLIDDHFLGISTIRIKRTKAQERIHLIQGHLYHHLPDAIKTHHYLLTTFQRNSVPLQTRLDAIQKSGTELNRSLWAELTD